ncbi:cation-transporting P-type ATPase [Spongiibacter sp.]|uniref:cation-transporting P-type ATPase n=1 Tax=Spongiibacter sp. TaxID=2024860 RepID=UPI003563260A
MSEYAVLPNQRESHTVWHHLSADAALQALSSSSAGLSCADAETRLQQAGPNRLPEPGRRSGLLRLLSQFHNILIYVLLAAASVTALLNHWLDTAVIVAVVLVNAVIGFLQEGKAEKAMLAIRQMLAARANVLRDGARMTVDGESLVAGDVVLLEAGDKVPADLRLLSAHGISVQEAILTGESAPVEKSVAAVPEGAELGDRSCMLYSGTIVASGQCRAVVVATAEQAEIGRISELISSVETLKTPLLLQMDSFAKWLTILILLIAVLLLAFGYFVEHYAFTQMFMVVVGLSVAAIPEGLPAVLTITLAIGVQAMAKRNAIVRRLPAIETLGSVSVICTDKTGTLTRNEMMVSAVLTAQHLFVLEGIGYRPEGVLTLDETEVEPGEHAVLESMARAAALCNDAALRQKDGVWIAEGDPMEGALLAFSGKMDLAINRERDSWQRTDAIPFDARHRFMATLHHNHERQASVFVKGAPEQLIAMCSQQLNADASTAELDAAYWTAQADSIAAMGQRVLALAAKVVPADKTVLEHDDVVDSLTLLGLVGMIDPPRPEAISAVAECHRAGILVKMITGDHAQTAAAIAGQIGLSNTATVMTGKDLDGLNDIALQQAAMGCDIFARTSPEHKLRLVTALQAGGMTVAMTGDGVNDAPALKRADTGIAMGKKGSEAAKEAADLVLADDNFATIVAAVREGRTVYDNIKKIITWTLPTNAGEALIIVVAVLSGMALPITPVQILWVNLVTAVTLGVALAFEPTEDNTMLRPPRPRDEPLLTATTTWYVVMISVLILCGVYGVYQYAIGRHYPEELARTMVVNTLVSMEIFLLFFVRNIYGTAFTWRALRGTKIIWLVVACIATAQLAMTYWPPMQGVFDTQAVAIWDVGLIVAVGVAVLIICEIEKQMRLLLGRKRDYSA